MCFLVKIPEINMFVELMLDESDLVEDIKKKIYSFYGVDVSDMLFIYGNKIIDDLVRLSDCGITDGAKAFLVKRAR